jgi:hypothetical protein
MAVKDEDVYVLSAVACSPSLIQRCLFALSIVALRMEHLYI